MNQLARGKMHAFRDFRDVLAREMSSALPECAGDVARVVEATGGATAAAGREQEQEAGQRQGEQGGQQQ